MMAKLTLVERLEHWEKHLKETGNLNSYGAELLCRVRQRLEALRERAERVQEGEDWDLAEFILRED